MYAAVTQLAIVQVGFLGPFARQFGHPRHGLALFLALRDFLQHDFRHVGMLMQVVVYFLFDEVAHILVDGNPVGAHGERTKFYLCLALEHRLFHIHGDGCHQPVANVAIFEVLARKFLDGLGDMLLECALVRAALGGVLTVDERMILLAILVGMGEGYLYVLALHVYDGVDALVGHAVVEQVFQSVAAEDAPSVVHDGQPGVQVGVVAQHRLHDIILEAIVFEHRVVGFEEYQCARLVGGCLRLVVLQLTTFEHHFPHLALAVGSCLEMGAQRIHRLHAHSVEAHALLKCLGVVFATRIEHVDRLDEFSLRYASAIVAHPHPEMVFDIYLNTFSGIHLELVDGVVDDLLQQHIDTVFGQRTVAQSADIHTGAFAHMLHIGEVHDIVFNIFWGEVFCGGYIVVHLKMLFLS